jgi:hypothetical protein
MPNAWRSGANGGERILSWRHTGFNVHSRLRAKTKTEAERVGKYMIRPLLSLERHFKVSQVVSVFVFQ